MSEARAVGHPLIVLSSLITAAYQPEEGAASFLSHLRQNKFPIVQTETHTAANRLENSVDTHLNEWNK